MLHLLNHEKVKLRALFDAGATNSFIKASFLSKSFRAEWPRDNKKNANSDSDS
jgi:hypothetical protein